MSGRYATCKLLKYVKKADPAYADMIEQSCSDRYLSYSDRYGRKSITLVIPQIGTPYRKKIDNLAADGTVEGIDAAGEMIKNLIFCGAAASDKITTPAQWTKTALRNALDRDFPKPKASGTIGTGTEVVIDDEFVDSSNDKGIAVWKLVKGEPEIAPASKAGGVSVRRNRRAKTKASSKGAKKGGYDVAARPPMSEGARRRHDIFITAYQEYVGVACGVKFNGRSVEQHESEGDVRSKNYNPFVCRALSLATYVMEKDNEKFCKMIAPLVSYNEADFWILFEPHRELEVGQTYLIEDEMIAGWLEMFSVSNRRTLDVVTCEKALRAIIDGCATKTCCIEMDKCEELAALVDDIREDTLDVLDKRLSETTANPTHNHVIEAYKKFLSAEFEIGGEKCPILSKELRDWYNANGGANFRLVQDDMRLIACTGFHNMAKKGNPGTGGPQTRKFIAQYSELVETLNNMQFGNISYSIPEHILTFGFNDNIVAYAQFFCESPAFLFIPMDKSVCADMNFKDVSNIIAIAAEME